MIRLDLKNFYCNCIQRADGEKRVDLNLQLPSESLTKACHVLEPKTPGCYDKLALLLCVNNRITAMYITEKRGDEVQSV